MAFGEGCIDASQSEPEDLSGRLSATVEVETDEVIRQIPPYGFGIHTSVYDNALHHPDNPEELELAGITMLRYPGGGYSDNYHWATHTMTPWSSGDDGYLANRSDFGSYLELVFATDSALMITVNYGSNQAGDGPGEPKEAAAWVAYANGDPEDDTLIGEDSTGYDWKTVGFWAGLRAAGRLEDDDGFNFLRISREEPLGVEYWEIGNEVFGNGYYASGSDEGFELDLHVPYDGTPRFRHPDLSGTRYGEGVAEYSREMKAVDPDIKIGAVLVTPPDDYSWAPTWNDEVLGQCGQDIDFGVIHWYPNRSDLLRAPQQTIPTTFRELRAAFEEHAGENGDAIEVAVTELGTAPGAPQSQIELGGLFAGNAYLTYLAAGAMNVAWLELHNGTFLSEAEPYEDMRRGRAFQGIRLARMVAGVGDALVRATSSDPVRVIAHAGVREDGYVTAMLLNADDHRNADVTLTGFDSAGEGEVYRYDPHGPGGRNPQLQGPEPLEFVDGEATLEVPWRTMAVAVAPRR